MSTPTIVTSGRKTTRPRGYIEHYAPQEATMALLKDAIAVLDEYRDYLPLTGRQIFYRLANTKPEYPKTQRFSDRLNHHLGNARRGRMIPFSSIRDDGVSVYESDHYAGTDGFHAHVRSLAKNYKRDKMATQDVRLEVWCEASGMQPQLARVAERYSVSVYSCSGFDSITAKKMIADRACAAGKRAVILHLGDYDPSGVSLFKAVAEDVAEFVEKDRPHGYCSVEFVRVALTAEQVRAYALPTAPAKATDSRSKRWQGETCQLEALTPAQIAELLNDAILAQLDLQQLTSDIAAEEIERVQLTRALPAHSPTAQPPVERVQPQTTVDVLPDSCPRCGAKMPNGWHGTSGRDTVWAECANGHLIRRKWKGAI